MTKRFIHINIYWQITISILIAIFATNIATAQNQQTIIIRNIEIDHHPLNSTPDTIVITNESKSISFILNNNQSREAVIAPIYYYKMEGFDKEWITTSLFDNKVTYTHLDAGDYIFMLKDVNNNIQTVQVKIEESLWEKWWRIGVIGLILIGLVIIIYILRTSILVAQHNIKIEKDKLQIEKNNFSKQCAENVRQHNEMEMTLNKISSELTRLQQENDLLIAERDRNESKFKLVINNSRDMIFRMKLPEESLEYINKASFDLTSYSPVEFYKDPSLLKQIVCDKYRDKYIETFKQAMLGIETPLLEFKIKQKDGSEKWVCQRTALVIDENGKAEAMEAMIYDISEQKEKELSIESNKHKNEETDKLEEMFLANMVNKVDLTSNAIANFAEIIAKQKSNNTSKEALLRMMDEIIDIIKIESGQIEISKSQCYINSILEELLATFDAMRKENGKENISLKLSAGTEEENFSIFTDNFRFRQIMTNLLNNAMRYSDNGVIEFGYKLSNENNENNEEYITFFVHDTGKSLNEEELSQVFDRYKSLYNGGLENNKDDNRPFISDLGVSLAKNLVELLNGKMWVESKEGYGTTFFFTLPLTRQKGLKKKEQPTTDELLEIDWSQKTLLLAEDEENNYRYVQAALRKTKIEIIIANNGEQAVELFKENKGKIDVILMDIQMPKMNGYEATTKIKELAPRMPIVAQTAFAMAGGKIKCFEAGCDGYISKPYKAKELIEVLSKYI